MSLRRHRLVALILLCGLGAPLLFFRLGLGPLQVYDEGLYGMYARNALQYKEWLHAVDKDGKFPTGPVKFSKPPLSIWAVAASMRALGPTLLALRLPFALASLLTALLALAWGASIEPGARGVWLGFTWGALWLACHATYFYGRTATIEPLLIAFLMLALFSHSRALRAESGGRLRWAALSGASLALAFMTKQVVCAAAAGPILAVELLSACRQGARGPLGRLGLAMGIPLAVAAAWFSTLFHKVGIAALLVLWKHAVVTRVEGFDGLHHRNYLNRVADQLDLDAPPIYWTLGLCGLAFFFAIARRDQREKRGAAEQDAWLIAGMFAVAWLAFDVGSHAILPWYAMTLVPPLAFGFAFLLVRAAGALLQSQAERPLDKAAAGAGAGAFVALCALVARTFMPAILAGALAALAVAWMVEQRRLRPRLAYGALVAIGLLATAGGLARERYRYTETDPLARLGAILYKNGVRRVSIDKRLRVHPYARATFFGSFAQPSDAPPWLSPRSFGRRRADGRVEMGVLPVELKSRRAVHVARAAGVYAIWGDLTRPPFDKEAIAAALNRGGLTFEAEEFGSDRYFTLRDDSRASSGAVRGVDPWPRAPAEKFSLARGLTPELPRGRYRATFWLRMRCKGNSGERLGSLNVAPEAGTRATKNLDCARLDRKDGEVFTPVEVGFELIARAKVDLKVRYEQGALALDRIVIARDKPGAERH